MSDHVAFAAAYLSQDSNALLETFGFEREEFHLTTCFDISGMIAGLKIEASFPKTALIKDIAEWPVGPDTYLVAEMTGCPWSYELNQAMIARGAQENLPHNPHVTLIKGGAKGLRERYLCMIGLQLEFNRHYIKKKVKK